LLRRRAIDPRDIERHRHPATVSSLQRRRNRARCKPQARIAIDQHERAHKRTGDALPKQVQAVIETGKALVIEAKGLGRVK
jgi:hypothetical protein